MNARTLILAILNQKEATGYEIRKMSTEGPFSHFVDISFGSIYPTLAKLESEGLVSSRSEQAQGKPERKVYSISQAGRDEFIATMAQPPARDVFRSEFLLVAMAAEYGMPENVGRAIDERIVDLQSQIAMIREHVTGCDHPGTCWVARYGEYIMQCDLDYLVRHRDELVALAGTALPLRQAAE